MTWVFKGFQIHMIADAITCGFGFVTESTRFLDVSVCGHTGNLHRVPSGGKTHTYLQVHADCIRCLALLPRTPQSLRLQSPQSYDQLCSGV